MFCDLTRGVSELRVATATGKAEREHSALARDAARLCKQFGTDAVPKAEFDKQRAAAERQAALGMPERLKAHAQRVEDDYVQARWNHQALEDAELYDRAREYED